MFCTQCTSKVPIKCKKVKHQKHELFYVSIKSSKWLKNIHPISILWKYEDVYLLKSYKKYPVLIKTWFTLHTYLLDSNHQNTFEILEITNQNNTNFLDSSSYYESMKFTCSNYIKKIQSCSPTKVGNRKINEAKNGFVETKVYKLNLIRIKNKLIIGNK